MSGLDYDQPCLSNKWIKEDGNEGSLKGCRGNVMEVGKFWWW